MRYVRATTIFVLFLILLVSNVAMIGCGQNRGNLGPSPTSSISPDTNPVNGSDLYFEYGGLKRTYKIYIPQNLPTDAPLVFVLHGTNQFNNWSYSLGFNQLADTNGFLVAYPQSTTTGEGKKGTIHWNDANDDILFNGVDDVGFLSELARYLQTKYDLNPDRTFVTGFSNGGYMSYTLASQASEVFKAAASVAALMNNTVFNNCNPTNPIPILHIHGTADSIVPIMGAINKMDGSIIPPDVATLINLWVKLNYCTTVDTVSISENTIAYFYRNGIRGNEVHYYEIKNGAHIWPGIDPNKEGYLDVSGINVTEIIWEFFNKY